jgi:hypothetical protein
VSKIGRNEPCSCGSGKKFKKCCGRTSSEDPAPPNFERFLRRMGASSSAGGGAHDKKFGKVQPDLEAIFTAYSAEDVILTLGVSDLWLPNIASQIKHLFAFGIFAAIAPDRFNSNSRIENYDVFCDVLKRIHEILPTFPTLEDYVPETDWGEVKSHWQRKSLRLFYGSALERVPDFVEAFRFTNADMPLALDDMHTAILLQDRILTSIGRSVVGDAGNISSGHIEIPPEPFWHVCQETLRSVGRSFSDHTRFSPELVLDLGKLEFPKSLSAFGHAAMSGDILPALFVRTGKALIPVAPRSAVINIVDFWGRRAQAAPFRGHRSLTQQVSDFLASRVDYRSISRGPCWVRDAHRRVRVPFAAVLRGDDSFYFVVILSRENLDGLPTIEAELLDLVANSPDWGIQLDGASHGLQFRHLDGSGLKPDEIVVLAVLPQESTVADMVRLPQTRSAHVLPIVDLVSIFDSIGDLSEFDRFWAYIKATQSAVRLGFLSLADKFAAFRYSHGVLIDGAIQPDLVMLDPHSGSNWRFEELAKFWNMAPPCFPDHDPRGWMIERGTEGVLSLNSKALPVQTWATTVAGCTHCFSSTACN